MDYTETNKEEILCWLKNNLNEHRYEHSLGCAKCAAELAKKFNLDEKKAYIAGLLHDCAKNFEPEKMLEIIKKHIPDIKDFELENQKTLHAPVSAYIAKKEFKITDEEIISSIRWHTLGKIEMTDFEKIIFLADKIEPHTRNLEYRKKILAHLEEKNGLNKALLACYEKTIVSLKKRNMTVCKLTLDIYNKLKNALKAFTLSEVLIVITIIGVIAAITIPPLLNNIQNKQLETSFNKAYSMLSDAVAQMHNDEYSAWGNYNYRDNNGKAGYSAQTSFQNAFIKYFAIIKDCGGTGCVPNSATTYRNFNDTNYMDTSGITQRQFYTKDGMLIFPVVYSAPNTLIAIWIDTNGYDKRPNKAGHDLFFFQLMPDDRLLPGGAPGTISSVCNTSSTTVQNGYGCASKALAEKDYFKNLP